MISVHCNCGKLFTTRDENAGKKAKCAACGAVMTIRTSVSNDEIADLLGNPALNSAGTQSGRSHSAPPGAIPVNAPPPAFPSALGSRSSYASTASPERHRARRQEPDFFDWDSSVVVGIFDLKFARFITPAIIKSLYATHMVFVFLSLCALVWSNYRVLADTTTREASHPVLMYLYIAVANVTAIVGLFILTLLVRLCLEAVMVLFRGEEHLRSLAESAGGGSPG